MLGLCLAYLKVMHLAKLVQPDKPMCASAHLLKLFLNNPIVKLLLPDSLPHHNTLSKKLNGLQACLTSLESTLANLAKTMVEVRKDLKSLPTTPCQLAKLPSATKKPSPPPIYAAKTASPQHPSVVLDTSAFTWPENQQPSLTDICATINTTLDHSNLPQVHLSATKWTPKGNLVFWSKANTMVQQLTTSLPHISKALQASLSASTEYALQTLPYARPNIK